MDAYLESALQGVASLSAGWDYVLPALAAAPSLLFLKSGWPTRFGAVVILLAAAASLYFRLESVAPTVGVLVANVVLILVATLSSRKRIVQLEARLEVVTSAIRDLEIAEERRQTFGARNPGPPINAGNRSSDGLSAMPRSLRKFRRMISDHPS